jgi:hypothetical protein
LCFCWLQALIVRLVDPWLSDCRLRANFAFFLYFQLDTEFGAEKCWIQGCAPRTDIVLRTIIVLRLELCPDRKMF